MFLVCWIYWNLIVAWIYIHEAQQLMPFRRVDQLVYLRKWEAVLG